MSRKAQLWHFDLIIAIIIFTTTLILFYSGRLNIEHDTELLLDDINREGNFIADSLMSTGFPENWTTDNVIAAGIVRNNRFNQEKINNLDSLGYNKTRSVFRTKYNFYLFFEDALSYPVNMLPGSEGIGYPGVNTGNIDNVSTNNLIKITRFGVYNSEPVRMVLYIWT